MIDIYVNATSALWPTPVDKLLNHSLSVGVPCLFRKANLLLFFLLKIGDGETQLVDSCLHFCVGCRPFDTFHVLSGFMFILHRLLCLHQILLHFDQSLTGFDCVTHQPPTPYCVQRTLMPSILFNLYSNCLHVSIGNTICMLQPST